MASWARVRQAIHSQFNVTQEIDGCLWVALPTPGWSTHVMVQNVGDVALVVISNIAYVRDVQAQALMDASAQCILGVKRSGDSYVVSVTHGLQFLALEELASSVSLVGEQAHTYVRMLGMNLP